MRTFKRILRLARKYRSDIVLLLKVAYYIAKIASEVNFCQCFRAIIATSMSANRTALYMSRARSSLLMAR